MSLAVYYTAHKLSYNNDKEKEKYAEAEHCRWNAFMRANGYIYDTEHSDIAKKHRNLISYGKLTEKEKNKDRDIIEEVKNIK